MPERRTFLKALGAGALGAAATGFSTPPARAPSASTNASDPSPPDSAPTNWVWMTPELDVSGEEWRRRFERLRAHNIDAILPQVYTNSAAYYGSDFLPVEDEWLETILPPAKEVGLEVHGWMVSMPCTIPKIVNQHKEWFVVNRNGESAVDNPAYVDYYKFTCPNRPGPKTSSSGVLRRSPPSTGSTASTSTTFAFPTSLSPRPFSRSTASSSTKSRPRTTTATATSAGRSLSGTTGLIPTTSRTRPRVRPGASSDTRASRIW